MSDLAREASELDLDYFKRATRALALELPPAVYDDYAPLASALVARLGELTAERDAAEHMRDVTTELWAAKDARAVALESALRELVAAIEKDGGNASELGHRYLAGDMARAFTAARALLAHEPTNEATT